MLIVYGLLEDHPLSGLCEQFIREREGWLTTSLTLLEVQSVLTKVYGVDASAAAVKLKQFASGPIEIIEVDAQMALTAAEVAAILQIDLTDAVLLQVAKQQNVRRLATDDGKLARVCRQVQLDIENPIDAPARSLMAEWEERHLSAKGLPRLLRRVHLWLAQQDDDVAEHFWSQTGNGSHLP